MINTENRIPFNELGNKIGRTPKEYRDHMAQEFKVTNPIENSERELVMTRSDYEDTMASMQCWFISDDAMARMANLMSKAMEYYDFAGESEDEAEDDLCEAFCREEEEVLRSFGVCYYEDEIPPISKPGARVFSIDYGYGTFNKIVNVDNEEMVEMTTDEGKVVTTWPGLVVEEY